MTPILADNLDCRAQRDHGDDLDGLGEKGASDDDPREIISYSVNRHSQARPRGKNRRTIVA